MPATYRGGHEGVIVVRVLHDSMDPAGRIARELP
jgi:hypothetical protein